MGNKLYVGILRSQNHTIEQSMTILDLNSSSRKNTVQYLKEKLHTLYCIILYKFLKCLKMSSEIKLLNEHDLSYLHVYYQRYT
jgi:hypothetical protein